MKPETIETIARHLAGIIKTLERERRRNIAELERLKSRIATLEKNGGK
jgi:hypothetical protein